MGIKDMEGEKMAEHVAVPGKPAVTQERRNAKGEVAASASAEWLRDARSGKVTLRLSVAGQSPALVPELPKALAALGDSPELALALAQLLAGLAGKVATFSDPA